MLQLHNRAAGLCLDVFVGETEGDGRQCGCWEDGDQDNQKWYIKPAGDGFFMFKNKDTGYVLDCYENEEYNGEGNRVGAWPEHGGDNQLWSLCPSDSYDWFSIKNKATGKALDVDMGSNVGEGGDGKQVIVWPHHGEENQQWGWGRSIMIVNRASGMALDCFVDEGWEGGGKQVGGWEPHGGANQRWKVVPCWDGSSAFHLKNAEEEDFVLDSAVDSEYNGDGKRLGAWEKHGGENQQFELAAAEDGYYILRNVATGQALDMDMESSVGAGGDGKQAITWPEHGEENQQWTFIFPNV